MNWSNNVGKFSTGMTNENGEKLLQFCSINDVRIVNTMYEHPPKLLYTWSSPNGKTQNQIDFIIFPNDQKRFYKKLQGIQFC